MSRRRKKGCRTANRHKPASWILSGRPPKSLRSTGSSGLPEQFWSDTSKRSVATTTQQFGKGDSQISDLNDSLKSAAVIDTPQWRFIQYSGDVRILCAQDKESEPTTNQTNGLMAWVANRTKTIVTTMSGTHAPY